MRLIYMGTPDFAVLPLRKLIEAGHEMAGVVTQKDKPKGRGGKMQFTPVKEEALKYGIEVYQPESMKDDESIEWVRSRNPDVAVVAAFGQILPKEVLDIPKYGCINIHASLLPRLRGASPIQRAVIDGDKESGITIMQMDEGLDTGDILLTRSIMLAPDETGGSLFDKLAVLGAETIVEALKMLEKGELKRTSQTGESSYAGMLNKGMGLIDFGRTAVEIERLVRGLNPWPSAFTYIGEKMIKIWKCFVLKEEDMDSCTAVKEEAAGKNVPGEIVKVSEEYIYVKTGKDILVIEELQPEGKKRMETAAYLRGCKIEAGVRLGKLSQSEKTPTS